MVRMFSKTIPHSLFSPRAFCFMILDLRSVVDRAPLLISKALLSSLQTYSFTDALFPYDSWKNLEIVPDL